MFRCMMVCLPYYNFQSSPLGCKLAGSPNSSIRKHLGNIIGLTQEFEKDIHFSS